MSSLIEKGLAELRSGEYAQAIKLFDRVLETDELNIDVLVWRGNAFLALGNVAEAENTFNRAAKIDSNDPRPRIGKALVHALRKNPFDAVDELSSVMRSNPAARQKYVQMSQFALKAIPDGAEFVDEATKALLRNIDNPNFYIERADELYSDDDVKSHALAMLDFTMAIEIDPENAELLESRSDNWCSEDFGPAGWSRGADDWSRILELQPSHESALDNRAFALYQAGRLDEAMRDVESLIRREPRNPGHHKLRSGIHMAKEEWDDAISDINTALQMTDSDEKLPDHERGSLFQDRAQAKIKLGDLAGAVLDLSEAVPLVDSYLKNDVIILRAQCHAKLGENDKALADFDHAVKRGRKNKALRAVLCRAGYFAEQGQYDKALADVNEVFEADPGAADAHLERARIYQKMGDKERAAIDYRRAIEIDPELRDERLE